MLENIIPQSSVEAIENIISGNERFVLLSHKNPDGDALGSSLALFHYLKNMGKNVTVVLPNPHPDFLAWLPSVENVIFYDSDSVKAEEVIADADAFFCLDFNDFSRIGDVGVAVVRNSAPKVLVDHHLFPSEDFVVKISYPQACSTSELVYRLVERLSGDDAVTFEMAQCIYTGMMTDTGAFAYASSRKDIFLIIAALLDKGIDKDLIYRKVFYTSSLTRMRLHGYVMYKKMKLYNKYNATLITLDNDELQRFYAVKGDTEFQHHLEQQILGRAVFFDVVGEGIKEVSAVIGGVIINILHVGRIELEYAEAGIKILSHHAVFIFDLSSCSANPILANFTNGLVSRFVSI